MVEERFQQVDITEHVPDHEIFMQSSAVEVYSERNHKDDNRENQDRVVTEKISLFGEPYFLALVADGFDSDVVSHRVAEVFVPTIQQVAEDGLIRTAYKESNNQSSNGAHTPRWRFFWKNVLVSTIGTIQNQVSDEYGFDDDLKESGTALSGVLLSKKFQVAFGLGDSFVADTTYNVPAFLTSPWSDIDFLQANTELRWQDNLALFLQSLRTKKGTYHQVAHDIICNHYNFVASSIDVNKTSVRMRPYEESIQINLKRNPGLDPARLLVSSDGITPISNFINTRNNFKDDQKFADLFIDQVVHDNIPENLYRQSLHETLMRAYAYSVWLETSKKQYQLSYTQMIATAARTLGSRDDISCIAIDTKKVLNAL